MNDNIGVETTPKTSGLAITSLILGILSIFCLTILAGIPGVICGHQALSRIRRSGGALTGEGLAIGGLVTGYFGIALAVFVLPLLMAIAIPNFVRARAAAQKNACVNNLRMIYDAKQRWAIENKKEQTATPTESDLAPYLKGPIPKCPAGGDYKLNAVQDSPTCSIETHKMD